MVTGFEALGKRQMSRSITLAAAVGRYRVTVQGFDVYSYIIQPKGGGAIVENANNTLNVYLQEVSTAGSFTAISDGALCWRGGDCGKVRAAPA